MTSTQGNELLIVLKRVADALEIQNQIAAKMLGNRLHDPECWRSGCYNTEHGFRY